MISKISPARKVDKRQLVVDDTKDDQKINSEQSRTKRRKIGRDISVVGNEKTASLKPTKQENTPARSLEQESNVDQRTPVTEPRSKEKHGRKEKGSQPADNALSVAGDVSQTKSTTAVSRRHKGKSSGEFQSSNNPSKSAQWSVLRTVGGRFADIDTIITPDEKHFILFSNAFARVFSVATSSVVRTLEIQPEMRSITACKLSPVNPEHLYMSTVSGAIMKWDWISGEHIETWNVSGEIFAIDICTSSSGKDCPDEDVVVSMNSAGSGEVQMTMHSKRGSDFWNTRVIREMSATANELKVSSDGRVIIIIADDQLFVGYRAGLRLEAWDSIKYTWLEVTLSVAITCCDIRERSPSDQMSSPTSGVVDLVVGDVEGAILIYHDILNSLLRTENKSEAGTSLATNRLHWHRNAVKTVKWSRDGNYIISGGSETVIVQYQLDTGRKQFLPHLSSHICSIVVSRTGKFYAIRLADNSAMVLSTSELRPIASVSGVQLPSEVDDVARRKPSQGRKKDKSSTSKYVEPNTVSLPAVLHPVQSEHLLAAVPSSPARSPDSSPSASSLQTFNVLTNQQVSRQALARTNATIVKTGPQGTELTTPDVKFLGITSDGEWLSTVDEWLQYSQDVSVLYPPSITPQKERREIFLKFWRWNESAREWELSTRIDAPHFDPSFGSAQVLDLVANPAGSAFVTVGEDAVVRIWSPNARYRSGQTIKDKQNQTLQTWRAVHSIALERFSEESESAVISKVGSLAFSDDGSVLAVCWTDQSGARLVYLINPKNGEICHARDNLYLGTPRGLGFLDRHLVVLSDQLVVWDTVADIVKLTMLMEDNAVDPKGTRPKILAVNRKSQTFAISFTRIKRKGSRKSHKEHPQQQKRGKARHQLAIFDVKSLRPVFQSTLDYACRALLSDLRTGEYVLIDAAAQIQQIGSGDWKQLVPQIAADASSSLIQTGLENIFGAYGHLERVSPAGADAAASLPTTGQIGRGQEAAQAKEGGSLTDIFDVGPSFVLPGVDTFFEGVVKHFSRANANAVTV
ncbi:WD domain-containing protein [Histoplasma capsulatum G186AR]|uniref:WD domain-containing protein n=2 Tax=Ajellomyces capsulatus TaxID=5037 RepID=C0NZB4_AJECG|nr:WD domain-containing protein [Histoplasma capsulatum G186AR]EEH03162.1 WD domain-containing protein [Histoplasma capsulatum G186AR]KAG5290435.1 WD domain-containing protein [Histoplasma capsulatum]QSS72363.1 WD domain-containing protein [Histoplasma capsulatum G186AR]